jgi:hypothetical protein
VLLHTGSLSGQPGRLKAVADFIHVPGRRRRLRAVVRLGGWAHGVTSFAQASRINRSFRSTVVGCPTQLSSDLLVGVAFQFPHRDRPQLVIA